jgi:hypothetical protein
MLHCQPLQQAIPLTLPLLPLLFQLLLSCKPGLQQGSAEHASAA